ncbi:MAG: hypothetical protein WDN44_16245 [Sphingomonas sp.]
MAAKLKMRVPECGVSVMRKISPRSLDVGAADRSDRFRSGRALPACHADSALHTPGSSLPSRHKATLPTPRARAALSWFQVAAASTIQTVCCSPSSS